MPFSLMVHVCIIIVCITTELMQTANGRQNRAGFDGAVAKISGMTPDELARISAN